MRPVTRLHSGDGVPSAFSNAERSAPSMYRYGAEKNSAPTSERATVRIADSVNDITVTLTTVAGILLGFGLVVMDRADRSSSRRAQAVFSANRQRVDCNWEIILLMPAAAVVGGLFAVMFGPLAVQWWATVVGYLAAGTGLSAIRMAWFFVVQRELAAVESASKRKEPLRDLASPCN